MLVHAAASAGAQEKPFTLHGVLASRIITTRSQRSWTLGGFGRLTEGAEAADQSATDSRTQAHLGFDWRPSDRIAVHVHGLGRTEPQGAGGDRLGVVEAFLAVNAPLSERVALRFKAGSFFPSTSRENTAPLWQSPYTVTLSAWNSWIAEEVRLVGLEAGVGLSNERDAFLLAGTVFGGNDPSGTLLAKRGFSFGDRLTTLGEVIRLPPLPSFRPGGAFASQRPDGTRPVDELDGRPGFGARARWSRGDSALLQAAYVDNRGDRELHDGQYAWRTRFGHLGGELLRARSVTVVAEAAYGNTTMGPRDGVHVDVDFAVGYGLVSWSGRKTRLSLRHDRFRNLDRDGTAESNQESGSGWTFAAFWSPNSRLRLGLELLDVRADRPAAAESGADPDTDARHALVELRLSF